MRIPAAITAASLTLAPATPAEPVEQLLDDVSATHETSITAINSAETDDEVRDVLIAWRKELIAASDELAELREEAAEDGLTKDEKATFDEAAAALKRERAGVRQLRSELLPDDEPVVVPAPIEGLGGILGTTAIDAFERSETGDAPIVFGIPGAERTHDAEEATTPTVVEEPTTPSTSPAVVTTPSTSAPTSTAPGVSSITRTSVRPIRPPAPATIKRMSAMAHLCMPYSEPWLFRQPNRLPGYGLSCPSMTMRSAIEWGCRTLMFAWYSGEL